MDWKAIFRKIQIRRVKGRKKLPSPQKTLILWDLGGIHKLDRRQTSQQSSKNRENRKWQQCMTVNRFHMDNHLYSLLFKQDSLKNKGKRKTQFTPSHPQYPAK